MGGVFIVIVALDLAEFLKLVESRHLRDHMKIDAQEEDCLISNLNS